ncbi:hypothetical protein A3863_03335 [Priestia endophytica]|uniref:PH domain-containing protein n=1 Tax=Priestia endophytica TaxID=135735 RepID=A0AAX1QEK5_9BACI|nr:hypothetical protein A3864_03890 [Priestia endophytica]RAS92285.1 hypothetical protein A3863_03335 [Priestia endophytica]
MEYIQYRRSIVLMKLLGCIPFVAFAVWLIFSIPRFGFFEQLTSIVVIIVAFLFFGQHLVIFFYFLVKSSSVLCSIDKQFIYYKDRKFAIRDIEKILDLTIHVKRLPGGISGFRFKMKDGKVIEIPTHYLLTLDQQADALDIVKARMKQYKQDQ